MAINKDERQKAMEDKEKALESAIAGIQKEYGVGSIMRLGDNKGLKVESVTTGCLSLDLALGIGGMPCGRVIEIYGPESSGKTTLALHVLAEVQKRGGIGAVIDVEHALDPLYAERLGVDVNNLLISQPDCGEDALDIAEALIRSGAVDCVVVDSVAALVPRAEIEGEMGDAHVGLQARLMSQALRKLTGTVAKTKCILIFINQLREKVGVMFGNPEVQPGGRALKFYASVRLDIRRVDTLKNGNEIYGNRVKVKTVKNKLSPPFKEAEFDIRYGEGIDFVSDLLDVGVNYEVVTKSGAWYSYGDMRLGQGKEKAREFLLANPDVLAEVEQKVRAACGLLKDEAEDDFPLDGVTPKADGKGDSMPRSVFSL